MTTRPQQLVLDLPHRSALGAEDFFVSSSNSEAVAMIDRWPHWPHWAVLVAGPAGAGKSHLVNVWRARSGAECVTASALNEASVDRLERARALVIEDVDAGIGNERVLFHLLNLAHERERSILLTSRTPPGKLGIMLPDLRSRLRAVPLIRIAEPDQALLGALLVKLFADRQLRIEPHVVAYIALHVERSTQAVSRVVAEIDRLALSSHRRVTRVLAAEALGRLGEE